MSAATKILATMLTTNILHQHLFLSKAEFAARCKLAAATILMFSFFKFEEKTYFCTHKSIIR